MSQPPSEGNAETPIPSVEEIFSDPAATLWLRQALRTALSRDPVDAANDAELLARILDRRCRELFVSS